jgi:putative ABC transport system permease protein
VPLLFATAELGRAKARYATLTLGAGLLVFVLLFQQALLTAVLDGMSGALRNQSAPVLVYARQAQKSFAGSIVTEQQLADVKAVPGVADAAELAVTLLTYQPAGSDDRVNASVIGYRPGRAGTPLALDRGRLPKAADEVVASGEDAAGHFGVGDQLTIEPGGKRVRVVGLTKGGRLNVGPTLWTPWDTYEQLVRSAAPAVPAVLPSVLAVEPGPGVSTAQVVARIDRQLPDLEALTRRQAADEIPGRDAIRLAFTAVMGLGYLVVAVVIGFFFLTMTLQKEASVTLLRAVGARSGYLVRALLVQVAVVTFGGLAIGTLALLAVTPLLGSTMAVDASLSVMLNTAVPALAVALLGAIPPLRRVMRADPFGVVRRPSLGATG